MQAWKCDQCGKTAPANQSNWIAMDQVPAYSTWASPERRPVHVCSAVCLARLAVSVSSGSPDTVSQLANLRVAIVDQIDSQMQAIAESKLSR